MEPLILWILLNQPISLFSEVKLYWYGSVGTTKIVFIKRSNVSHPYSEGPLREASLYILQQIQSPACDYHTLSCKPKLLNKK